MTRRGILMALMVMAVIALAGAMKSQAQQPTEPSHASAAAHSGDGEHGSHEARKFLGLPAWIWKLVNMVAFLGFLGWLIGGPVKAAIAARHDKIQKEAVEARERRIKADQMAADIQARLSQIEEDIRSIGERARIDGEKQKQELITAAEAEAAKILQNARIEMENRVRTARQELTEYAGQLATERAEQILRDKITESDQKKLFSESVREVEGARS